MKLIMHNKEAKGKYNNQLKESCPIIEVWLRHIL